MIGVDRGGRRLMSALRDLGVRNNFIVMFVSTFVFICRHKPLWCAVYGSSRRQHTRWPRDWSSDVCSSDLDGRLDIVDGQQRTISLHLMSDILAGTNKFNTPKNKSFISKNYYELKRLHNLLPDDLRDRFKRYFYEKCTVIVIKIDNEMEAFQFFDSQNARGKPLRPHDLLKAYHLREMNAEKESIKLKLIDEWENQETKELADIFQKYLYRIKTWIGWEDAHYFSRDGVDLFKGTSVKEKYNFIQYHKAAYLFMENLNRDNLQELLGVERLIPFQIDQDIISGRRFFEYVLYYMELKQQIEKLALSRLPKPYSDKS